MRKLSKQVLEDTRSVIKARPLFTNTIFTNMYHHFLSVLYMPFLKSFTIHLYVVPIYTVLTDLHHTKNVIYWILFVRTVSLSIHVSRTPYFSLPYETPSVSTHLWFQSFICPITIRWLQSLIYTWSSIYHSRI